MTGVHVQLAVEDDKWPQLLPGDFSSEISNSSKKLLICVMQLEQMAKFLLRYSSRDKSLFLTRSPLHTRGQQCCQRRQAGRQADVSRGPGRAHLHTSR